MDTPKKKGRPHSLQKGFGHLSVPMGLWNAVDFVLKSRMAKRYGFTSKADFCVRAIRNELERMTGQPSYE